MATDSRTSGIYRSLLKYWNAALAGASLIGVAVFSVTPNSEKYVQFFVFLGANAIVWTVIEMKVKLEEYSAVVRQVVYPTMRAARSDVLQDIKKQLRGSRRGKPLVLVLIGGRMRSMSEVVREIADGMTHGQIQGHIKVDAYCISPDYLASRILPGDVSPDMQLSRNTGIAHLVRSVRTELESLSREFGQRASLSVSVRHYSEDPFCYAYLIGDNTLYWGPFTWDGATSDLLGPENPCIVVRSTDPTFPALREWVRTRTDLMRASSKQVNP